MAGLGRGLCLTLHWVIVGTRFAHDMERYTRLAEPVGKVGLNAATAAHDRLDRLEREHAGVALIGCGSPGFQPKPSGKDKGFFEKVKDMFGN